MNVNGLKIWLATICGAVGGFIADALGGWTSDVITLIIFMAIDFFMGLVIACVFKSSPKTKKGTLSSKVSFMGLCKKCTELLFVVMAERLDVMLGVDYVRNAVVIAFCVSELLSIVENAGIMGVPMPDVMKKAIELLQSKEGDE